MGVLTCSRNGCEHIMCDTYVEGVGYVCSDCQGEFKKWLQRNDFKPSTENAIDDCLKEFMKTDKYDYEKDNETSIADYFNKYRK